MATCSSILAWRIPMDRGVWAAILQFSSVQLLSCILLFVTPCTVAYQVPQYMGFSMQRYWSGLPFPTPGDLPDPGIELASPALQVDSLPSEPPAKFSDEKERLKVTGDLWPESPGFTPPTRFS